MANYIHQFIFGVFPYIAGTVFLVGSLLRFERGQYTWRAMSSQMLTGHSRWFRPASLAFHIGILFLFFGHLVGLLTPTWFYQDTLGIDPGFKQLFAIVSGGAAGLLCLFGLTYLLWRRLFVPRVRNNSAGMDTFIICLIWLQLMTGMSTTFSSIHHLDGGVMQQLAHWAQSIVTFQAGGHEYITNVHWIYKMHIFLGLVMFTAFPFSRLVHIWSWPWAYTRRRYQVVRQQ
ncbi:respiratory nitrate reductase subunit gamma [Wenzhouxiangella limi]|uniref:nitrate reductase (quinone) n=1 Tax=Wenzhouxiangella limi TaxID=2707351 RepID=A0A845UWK8_9GAMM|nr:respiratory nitrate reductase subunit gamma [Wenzhouxiangella limi]NDY96233.1 respiratory nitrate reductase subunit gamma [Wenzhouxiangella limi]